MHKSLEKRKVIPKLKLHSPLLQQRATPEKSHSSRLKSERNSQIAKACSPKNQTDLSQLTNTISPSIVNSLRIDKPFEYPSNNFESIFQEVHSTSSNIKNLEKPLEKSKQNYESQVDYKQRYIGFLKRKAGVSKDFESFEMEFSCNSEHDDAVKKLKNEIESLNQVIKSKDQDMANYLDELCEKENQILYLRGKMEEAERVLEREKNDMLGGENKKNFGVDLKVYYEKQIKELEKESLSLKTDNMSKSNEIKYLQNEIKDLQLSVANLKTKLTDQVSHTINLQSLESKKINEKISAYEKRIISLIKIINHKNPNLLGKNQKICKERLEDRRYSDQKDIIENLKDLLSKANSEIQIFNTAMHDLKTETSFLEHLLENEKSANSKLQKHIHQIMDELANEKKWRFDKLQENSRLNEKTNEFEAIITEKNNELSKNLAKIEALKNNLNLKHEEIMRRDLQIQEIKAQNHNPESEKQLSEDVKEVANKDQIEKNNCIEEFKKHISEKTKKIDKLSKIIHEQNNEIKRLQEKSAEIASVRNSNKELEYSLMLNNKKLNDLYGTLKQDKAKIDELVQLNTELNDKIKEKLNQNQNLQAALEEKESNIIELEKVVENKSVYIENLAESNQDYRERLKYKSEIIKTQETCGTEQSRFIVSFDNKVRFLERELDESLENIDILNVVIKEEKDKYEDIINQIKQENEELNEKIVILSQQIENNKMIFNQSLKEKDIFVSDLQLELDKQKSINENLTLDFNTLKLKQMESETNQTKTTLAFNEAINTQKITEIKIKKELADSLSYNKELKYKIDTLDLDILKNNEEIKYLKEKIDELQINTSKNREKYIQTIEDLKTKILELETNKKKSDDEREKEKNTQNAEILKLKNTENELTLKTLRMENELANFHEETRQKNAKINSKDTEIYKQRFGFLQEINDLKAKIKEKDSEILSNNDYYTVLQENLNESNTKISSLSETIENKDKELLTLHEKLENTHKKIVQLRDENELVTKNLNTYSESLQSKESTILSLTNKISSLQSSIIEQQSTQNMEKKIHLEELLAKDVEISQKNSQVNILQSSLDRMVYDTKRYKLKAFDVENTLKSRIYELKEEKKALMYQKKSIEKENFSLKTSVVELKEKIQHFENNIKAVNEENTELMRIVKENESLYSVWKSEHKVMVKGIESENEGLNRMIEEFKNSEGFEVKIAMKDLDNKEEMIRKLESEIRKYRDEIQKLSIEKAKNEIKVGKRKEKKKNMQEELNKLIMRLKKEIKEKDSELIITVDNKNLLINENIRLNQEKQLYEEKSKELITQSSNLHKILLSSNDEISHLKEQLRNISFSTQTESTKSLNFSSKIQQLEEENQEKALKILEIEQHLSKIQKESNNEISSLKGKTALQTAEIQELKNLIETGKNELKLYKLNVNERESNIIKLNLELTDQLKHLQYTEIKLKNILRDLTLAYDEANCKIAENDEKIATFYEENKVLRKKLEEIRKKSLETITEQANLIAENTKTINTLENELNETKQALEILVKKHNELIKTTDEYIYELKSRLKEFQDDLVIADEELTDKNNELINLRQLRTKIESENKLFSQTLSLIDQEKTQKDILIQELESQFNNYKNLYEKENELSKNMKGFSNDLAEENKAMEDATVNLKKDNCKYVEMIKNLESLVANLKEEYETTVESKNKELEELGGKLMEDFYKIEELNIKIKELKTDFKESESSLIEENLNLKSALKISKMQIENLQSDLYSLQEKISESSLSLSNHSDKSPTLEISSQISFNKVSSFEQSSQLSKANQTIAHLKSELETLSKTTQELQHQNTDLIKNIEKEKSNYQTKLSNLNKEIQELTADNKRIVEEFKSLTDINNHLNEKLKKIKKAYEDISSAFIIKDADLSNIIKEKDLEIQKIQNQKAELDEYNKSATSLSLSLNEKIIRDAEIIGLLKDEIGKLQESNKSLEENMSLRLDFSKENKEDNEIKDKDYKKMTIAYQELNEICNKAEEKIKELELQNGVLIESNKKVSAYINTLENNLKGSKDKARALEKILDNKERMDYINQKKLEELEKTVEKLRKYEEMAQGYEKTIEILQEKIKGLEIKAN
ncbi:hypothetical protein SteCoe_723 [Stentor coeruleus]|uniref:Uncharacterized protein n=1 Tax=Stentor coeruleus TaxID=5963 RepID=A0A1R2D3N7_9CILI|nr:hypothetical protein SteCoe_723 [Stentor coeruleus]